MNLTAELVDSAPPKRTALVAIARDGERREIGFGEVADRSARMAGALASRGVGRGDVVMTVAGNRPEWVYAMLACWRLGAVAQPCTEQLRPADLRARMELLDPRAVVADERDLDLVSAAGFDGALLAIPDPALLDAAPAGAAKVEAGDPALIVFTSGTTGEPRAALHSQRYLPGQRAQAEQWLGARPGELVWCTTATGWSKSARNVFVAPWLCGAAAMIVDGRFEADERLELIEREGVDVLCQAPTEYRALAKRTALRELPSLRRMVSAGEALNPEVIEAWREATGLAISDGYGQTETGHLTGNLAGDEVRPGSMGRPLPGFDLRIADDELQVRVATCPTFFDRYLDAEPFDGEWWPTGDVVREDADGYLWYEGRNDDLILSAGYRIGPFEVESALLTHPAVAEAAAVPAPDAERGAVVRAVVVLRDRAPSPELVRELQEHVRSETAPYKYPRIVDFADQLPRTASGKIKRAELRLS